nr:hypothetical protein [uncultured Undibacterium sp.]
MATHQIQQKTLVLSLAERLAYEQKWRRIFSFYGVILAAALIYMVAFYYSQRSYAPACYVIGSFSAIGCLYAAKKLRDIDRVDAAVDAQILLGAHNDDALGDIDD